MQVEKNKNKHISSFLNERKSLSKEEQITEAQNIISELDKVDVDSATKSILYQINQKKTIPLFVRKMSRIAAILFIPVFLVSLWSIFISVPKLKNALVAHQEVSSPAGVRTKIELSDGSQVWLNAESTIKFPVAFVGNTRDIELDGEAYFEVTENKKKPFVVNAENARVKVLGTSFNFKNYKNEDNIEVVLKEGKVLFESAYNNQEKEQILTPGNRVVVNKETGRLSLHKVQINKYVDWHENKLVFNESPIQELAEKLERWYGVEVVVKDKDLCTFKLTTTFENEPIQQVLELIELSSPIELVYHASTYNDKNGFTKPQVIISKNRTAYEVRTNR